MASRTSILISIIACSLIGIARGDVYSNRTSNSTALGHGTGTSSASKFSIIPSSSGVSTMSTTEEMSNPSSGGIGGYIASALGMSAEYNSGATSTSATYAANSTSPGVPASTYEHSNRSSHLLMYGPSNSTSSCSVICGALTHTGQASRSLSANSTSPSLSVLPHGHSKNTSSLPTYNSADNTSSYAVTAVHTVLHTSIIATGYAGGNANSSIANNGTTSKLPIPSSGASAALGNGYPRSNGVTSKPANHTSGAVSAHGTGFLMSGPYRNGTNNTTPRTGSGYIYANACNQASVSWSEEYISQWATPCSGVWPDTVYTAPPSSAWYTLCDGIPRMKFNTSTTATPFSSMCETMTTATTAPPQPNCTILLSDCASLLRSYSIAHDVPPHVTLGRAHLYYSYIPNDFPRCTTNSSSCSSPGADCGIYGSGIQLMYWPQTWESGYCGPKQQSVTLGPTISGRPNTVKLFNTTFTSPTVYIKYDTLWASDYCDAPVGTSLYNGFVPVESALVSTKLPYYWTNMPWEGQGGLMDIVRNTGIIQARWNGGYPGLMDEFADEIVSLDYPDLDGPVPAIPYFQARAKTAYYDPWCWDGGGCPTMMPWEYQPVLAIPEVMRTLAPEWMSCSLPWGAMNDPPTALVSVSALASVTEPSQPTGPSATPCVTAQPVQETSSAAGGGKTSTGGNDPPGPAETGTKKSPSAQNNPTGQPAPEPYSAIPSPSPSPDPASLAHSSAGKHNHSPAPEPSSSDAPAADPSPDASPAPASLADHHTAATTLQDAGGILASVLANSGKQAASPSPTPDPNQAPDPAAHTNGGGGGGNSPDPAPAQTGSIPAGNNPSPGNGTVKVTLGSQTITAHPAADTTGAVVVGSNTLVPGGSAASINGHSVSLGSSGKLSVDGSSAVVVPIQTDSAGGAGKTVAAVTLGSQVFTASRAAASSRAVVIGSQTLQAGGSGVTIDGHSVSLGRNGRVAVDGSSAGVVNLHPAPQTTVSLAGLSGTLAAVTLGSQTVYAKETVAPDGKTEAVVGSQTLTVGGSAATVSGHLVSAGSSGLVIEPDSQTVAFHDSTALVPAGSATLTAEQTILPDGQTAAVIDGTTFTSGSPAETINGEVLSFGSQGLVLEPSSQTVPFSASTAYIPAGAGTLTARETVLPNGQTAAIIDGTTVTSGQQGTISGSLISFGSQGLVVQTPALTATFGGAASTAHLTLSASETLTARETVASNGKTEAIIGTHTLTQGGAAATIYGEIISLGSAGLIFHGAATTAAFEASAALVMIGSYTLIAHETVLSGGKTEAIIGAETLSLGGPAATIDGERVNLGSEGIVVGFTGGSGGGGVKSLAPVTAGASVTAAVEMEGGGAVTTTSSGVASVLPLNLWGVLLWFGGCIAVGRML